jgi:hypothetical protein
MPSHALHVEREQCTLVEKPARTGLRERYSVHGERRQRFVQSRPGSDRELIRCRFSERPEDAQDHGADPAGVLGGRGVNEKHGEA